QSDSLSLSHAARPASFLHPQTLWPQARRYQPPLRCCILRHSRDIRIERSRRPHLAQCRGKLLFSLVEALASQEKDRDQLNSEIKKETTMPAKKTKATKRESKPTGGHTPVSSLSAEAAQPMAIKPVASKPPLKGSNHKTIAPRAEGIEA